MTLAVICAGKGDRLFFVTSNRYIPVKNTLGCNVVVFCGCELIQLFCVASCLVRVVHKLEFRLAASEESN